MGDGLCVIPAAFFLVNRSVYFITLQCTYLLKQYAIPLTTGKATNGLKVGNFPSRVRGEVAIFSVGFLELSLCDSFSYSSRRIFTPTLVLLSHCCL